MTRPMTQQESEVFELVHQMNGLSKGHDRYVVIGAVMGVFAGLLNDQYGREAPTKFDDEYADTLRALVARASGMRQ